MSLPLEDHPRSDRFDDLIAEGRMSIRRTGRWEVRCDRCGGWADLWYARWWGGKKGRITHNQGLDCLSWMGENRDLS